MDHLRTLFATVLLLSGGFAYSTDFGDSVNTDPSYEATTVNQPVENDSDPFDQAEVVTNAFAGWGTIPDRSDVYGEVLDKLEARQAADSRTLSQIKTQVEHNGKRLDDLTDLITKVKEHAIRTAATSTTASWSPPVDTYSSGGSSGTVIQTSPTVSVGTCVNGQCYSGPSSVTYRQPVTSQPVRPILGRLFGR